MSKNIIGICHICGQTKELSQEHIPPKSSGNCSTVKFYTSNEFLADDILSGEKSLADKKYTQSQGGLKLQTLCKSCNNVTGANYVSAYSDFANGVRNGLSKINQDKCLNNYLQFNGKLKPLNFLKEVLAMFCSILPLETVADYKFGHYVLDKDLQEYENKEFDLYMYLSTTHRGSYRFSPPSVIGNFITEKQLICSELSAPPLGFVLSLSPKTSLSLQSIKNFNQFKLNEEVECSFTLPLLRPLELPLIFEKYSLLQ